MVYQYQKKRKSNRALISDYGRIANTRHLTRILIYLDEVGEAGVTKIFKNALIGSNCIKDGLRWLINHNLIEMNKTNQQAKTYRLVKPQEKPKRKIIKLYLQKKN